LNLAAGAVVPRRKKRVSVPHDRVVVQEAILIVRAMHHDVHDAGGVCEALRRGKRNAGVPQGEIANDRGGLAGTLRLVSLGWRRGQCDAPGE
jgi:hypothetical protein